jgi:hypothetical protein
MMYIFCCFKVPADVPCPSNWSRHCCCAAATAADFEPSRSELLAGLTMLDIYHIMAIYAACICCDGFKHLRAPAAGVAAAALPVICKTAPAGAQTSQRRQY